MERVVLSFRLRCSNDEGSCMSRAVLTRHREETVFLADGLHRVVLIYQGVSLVEIAGRTEGLGPFIEVIKVLVRTCITRISCDVCFDNSPNFRRALSRPDTICRHIGAPSDRTSNKSYSRSIRLLSGWVTHNHTMD